ncbi:cytochrome P450 [Xylaria venustula]|nr:cytochrome P450 [Xylaria venustula]
MFSLTTILLSVALALYAGYKWALPKPLPGIPYNVEGTKNTYPPISQTVHPLGGPLITVRDWRTARDVFLHRSREFDRSGMMIIFTDGLLDHHHFVLKAGAEWKLRRRLIHDTMSPSFLKNQVSHTIYSNGLKWIELWHMKARLAAGRPFMAYYDIHYAILDTVLGFSFGPDFSCSATESQINRLHSVTQLSQDSTSSAPVDFPEYPIHDEIRSMLGLLETLGEVESSLFIPLKWWLLKRSSIFRNRKRLKNESIICEIKKAVEARTRNTGASKIEHRPSWMRCAVELIVNQEARNAEREDRGPDFFSDVVVEEIWGSIVAGVETLSTTFSWGVKLLADHPNAQDRLRKTLRVAHARAIHERRLPTVEEILQTPTDYVDASIEEILRCSAPVPILARQAVVDTVLLGHHIPKGTNVQFLQNGPGIKQRELEENKNKYNQDSADKVIPGWDDEDVDQFKPERWLRSSSDGRPKQSANGAEDVERDGLTFNAQAGPSIPFGLGNRGCFGRRLAYMDLKILLTMVILSFELQRCPDELSGYNEKVSFVNRPTSCYVKLRSIALQSPLQEYHDT